MQRDRRDRNRGRGDTGVDAPDTARRPPPRAGIAAIAINRRAPYRRSFRGHGPAADPTIVFDPSQWRASGPCQAVRCRSVSRTS